MISITDQLLSFAEGWYTFDQAPRYYHNFDHALHVMRAVSELESYPSEHVSLAALYHDAVYIPGAGGNANECCSAAALGADWKRVKLESSMILTKAQTLIKWTSVDNHMTGERMYGDIAILLDADLASLASDWKTFEQNQHNIIIENGGALTKVNFQKCGQFLRRFLGVREYIYHTDAARVRWEDAAVTNIIGWCKKHDVPLSTNV